MLELINFANYKNNLEMINYQPDNLARLLTELGVDGVEALFCEPWDQEVVPAELIKGVHLNFWPTWIDFWRENQAALLRQFGSLADVQACFGGLRPETMLACYRNDLKQAQRAGAKYAVFHVSHNELDEMYTWRFRADSRTVIDATIELVNCLAADIPPDLTILFENLWWPGMTLLEPDLVERLLSRVTHPNVGIMLDTGHLMNTNLCLNSQEQGVAYIIKTLNQLGSLRQFIQGIHLHQSLSGQYVSHNCHRPAPTLDLAGAMAHVMKIDQHLPFTATAARMIVETIQPRYLVHEFIVDSRRELVEYTQQQRRVLL